MTLFDQPTATELREEGITKVSKNESTWLEDAHALIPSYPYPVATGEELRLWVESILGPPHHVNVFGAMVMGAVRKGLLTKTGRYFQSKRKESHARVNPEYTINRK